MNMKTRIQQTPGAGLWKASLFAIALGVASSGAVAATINDTETNDPTGSGSSLSFANAQFVGAGSHSIVGTTNPLQDVDLFQFSIAGGTGFIADLVSMTQTSIDGYQTHLYLFDSNKATVDFDFDPTDMNGTMGIRIDISSLAAGTYYLAVGGLNNHPVCNALGTCMAYDFVGTPVHHWNGLGQGTGNYVINVTSVPEAETYAMLLAGLGLVGFAVRRRLSRPELA